MKEALHIYIVDDEEEGIEILEHDLHRLNMEITVKKTFTDPKKALIAIQKKNPDLLLLDIEMPWMNGFEMLDALPAVDFPVIFITAYDQYAIKAFKYFAIDYLLKPVDIQDLHNALQRVITSKKKFGKQRAQALLEKINQKDDVFTRIALPTMEGYEFIEIKSIIRCKADNNYTNIFMENGNQLLVSKPLIYLQSLLESHRFFRTHHSHLINLDHVKKYVKTEGGYIEMIDRSIINISRSKKESFISFFKPKP